MGDSYPSDWDQRRRGVYQRDSYKCKHCGKEGGPHGSAELHAHHIVPKSEGGSHDASNLVTLCRDCHKKTESYPEENEQNAVNNHTGRPHTWSGPEWNSDKGLSQGKQGHKHNNTSGARPSTSSKSSHSRSNTTSSSEQDRGETTGEEVDRLLSEMPPEHLNNYSGNYSLRNYQQKSSGLSAGEYILILIPILALLSVLVYTVIL